MSTLTDRYVHATTRSVPEDRREDLGRELRAAIGDMVEARVEAGEDPAAAERAVLTDMGDPGVLAAQYADRPLHLIGPRYFLTYVRLLLKLLLWIPASVALVVLTVSMIADGESGRAIGNAVSAGIQVALQVAFWTTLTFAVLERLDVDLGQLGWTVDSLTEETDARQVTFVDTVGSILLIALVIAVLIGQNFRSWVQGPDGDDVALLDPSLWSGWLPFLIAVLVIDVGIEVWKFRVGRWTWPIAGTSAAASAAFALPVAWLAWNESLLNPAFVDALGMSPTVLGYVNDGIVAGAVLLVVIETIDAAWKSREAGLATPDPE